MYFLVSMSWHNEYNLYRHDIYLPYTNTRLQSQHSSRVEISQHCRRRGLNPILHNNPVIWETHTYCYIALLEMLKKNCRLHQNNPQISLIILIINIHVICTTQNTGSWVRLWAMALVQDACHHSSFMSWRLVGWIKCTKVTWHTIISIFNTLIIAIFLVTVSIPYCAALVTVFIPHCAAFK